MSLWQLGARSVSKIAVSFLYHCLWTAVVLQERTRGGVNVFRKLPCDWSMADVLGPYGRLLWMTSKTEKNSKVWLVQGQMANLTYIQKDCSPASAFTEGEVTWSRLHVQSFRTGIKMPMQNWVHCFSLAFKWGNGEILLPLSSAPPT